MPDYHTDHMLKKGPTRPQQTGCAKRHHLQQRPVLKVSQQQTNFTHFYQVNYSHKPLLKTALLYLTAWLRSVQTRAYVERLEQGDLQSSLQRKSREVKAV